MKQKLQMLGAALMLCTTPLFAHDFEVDGIYYNITSADDKTVEVTYKGDDVNEVEYSGAVTIPESVTYNGDTYSVTEIGEAAFRYCSGLTSVTIPNTVTDIWYSAFDECSSLTYVTIPNSVTNIKWNAFSRCSSLTSVEIPNSVTYIGSDAFFECSNLTSVEIGNSVTGIGSRAFSGCSSLTSITVADGNSMFDSRDNCNAIIETQTNTLIAGCSETTIPNSVTSIRDYAFYYCSSLTSVEIPNSVTSIGVWAFSSCSSLTSVVIPNSVTSIGEKAFSGCSSLTSVEIPNSVTSIGEDAFRLCYSLTSIAVAEDNQTYDSRNNCNAIIETQTNTLIAGCSKTTIPNSVTSIGSYAFQDCDGLTSVEIPNSVTSIGDYAFNNCDNLTFVEIPNSVTSIGEYAFDYCSSLTSVVIPNSVTSIGIKAFAHCSGLTSITVAADNSTFDSRDNCNAIIETQTNNLIAGCSETTIPNSVTSIGTSAFEGNLNLFTLIIPNTVTSIGDYAFSGCNYLTSVDIPNSVTSIGVEAFAFCFRLTSVEIPNSVTSIDTWAFGNCFDSTSITSYISADKLFVIDSEVFVGIDKTKCTLYVPYGAQDTYAATAGWNEFTKIVEMDAPTFDLTVSSAGYATLYLDYAVEIPTGVEVYTASEIEGDRLMMELVEGDVLPANTGVLVKAPKGTYRFNYTETQVSEIADNLFSGSATTKYVSVPSNKTAFVLSSVDGNVGMYLAKLTDGQFLNNSNKAYLLLSKDKLGISEDEVDTSIGGMQLSLRFDFNGSTGIDGVQTETSVQGAIYDLYGRKLQSAPTKGLYIVNGKKVLVK